MRIKMLIGSEVTGAVLEVPSGAATANADRVYLGEAAEAYAAGVTAERDRIRILLAKLLSNGITV